MKNKWLLLSLCAGYSFALCAQNPENDPVLMKVNGKSIKKSEFEYIYKKNNQQQTDSKSLDEYLELFKNYKLKVAEAEACGLDTTRSFRTELAGYRAQLVQPYLVDREMDDRLAKEAYDRLKENVEVSHILFRVNPGMTETEKDKVYQKAKSVLERIRKGEDFEKLAKEYSEDPSVKRNGGYLGYIGGFMTVYPFETAAYTTPVGSVSEPVLSQFGYHLIKVSDRRPDPGERLTAHIMLMLPSNASDEIKKEKEKYTIHTRQVAHTRKVGNTTQTYYTTETYYTWDHAGQEEWKTEKFIFLNVEFDYGTINFNNTEYLTTIQTDSTTRYVYYIIPFEFEGTLSTYITNNTITNNQFFYNKKIEKIIEEKKAEMNTTKIIFWFLWIFFIILLDFGYVGLDNNYLED